MVPAKTDGAMRRLSRALDEGSRAALVRALLAHTLRVVSTASPLPVTVVTAQEDARDVAARYGAAPAPDAGRGPNPALSRAVEELADLGVASAVILAADLPLLDAAAVRLLDRAAAGGGMAIAPDRLGSGTNALACPAGPFPFAFGPDSFRRHTAAAAARGWPVKVVRSPGLAVDLDEPWDLDLAAPFLDAGAPQLESGWPTAAPRM